MEFEPKARHFVSTRIGHLLRATELGSDATMQFDFDDAGKVLRHFIDNGVDLTARLLNSLGENVEVSERPFGLSDGVEIQTAQTRRTSPLLHAVDLEEMFVAFDGVKFLVRPSYTVCAQSETSRAVRELRNADDPNFIDVYSKVWFRFIALGEGERFFQKGEPVEDRIYTLTEQLAESMLGPALSIYAEVVEAALGRKLDIQSVGQLDIYSTSVAPEEFDQLFEAVSNGQRTPFSISQGRARTAFETLARQLVNQDKDFASIEDVAQPSSMHAFMQALRDDKSGNTRSYKVLALNDMSGNRGVFLTKVMNDRAKFVGLARDGEFHAVSSSEDPSVLRPSKAASNIATAILAHDLVVGV